jgi:hypothetical protein
MIDSPKSLLSTIMLIVTSANASAQLTITELMANNDGSYLDADGDASDWLEIHNSGVNTVSMEGMFLTDDVVMLGKWQLPALDVPADGYVVVFASAKDRVVAGAELHANFSLSASGEYLALVAANGVTVVSEFAGVYPKQFFGVSYGDDGYMETPTPGAMNAPVTYTEFVEDTSFDVNRGYFEAPFDVTITSATQGATIIYTTNGSTPSLTNGTQSLSPAVVNITTTTPLRAAAFEPGLRPSNVDTQTYFFLEDVLDQPVHPTGYPLPWIQRNGAAIGGDYEMDANVVGSVYSRSELKTALRDLPTFSIVTDVANLFDQQTGIQVNPQDAGEASERQVSVELLDFEDGAPVQFDAGMRMNGNASRSPTRPKHNFRLIFRSEYGAGRLGFPLFGDDAPATRFNQIVVRGGNGNSWVHPTPSVYNNAMLIRDQWFRDAHAAMGYPETLQREAHVYFNGLYWGVHHLFERIEEEWAAERFGGTPDEWEGFRVVAGNNIEVMNGTPAEENAKMLVSWRATLDAALAGDLVALQEYLDLDAYIDYILLNFYGGNNDWDANNVRALRRKVAGGKWMFFCHDVERAGFNALNTANININVTGKNTLNAPTSINYALRNNSEYALRFADRAYKHLFNNGALTPENGAAMWAARADSIREAMKAESARWGDFRVEPPLTLVHWEAALQREYAQWFPFRTPVAINQLRATGVYPSIDPPVFSQHGGHVASGYELVISNTGGAIYYTTDGSDPRLPGGQINPAATLINGAQVETALVPGASEWRYLDDGTDLGTAWRVLAFDDSTWAIGAGPLGFGGITNFPVLGTYINPSHFLTNYFRRIVSVDNVALLTTAEIEVMADAGAVVYLNGTEIARDNMTANTIAFNTPASTDGNEGIFDTFHFDPALFVDGDNIIAVELHNSATTSTDMAMDVCVTVTGVDPNIPRIPVLSTTPIRARSLDGGTWSALAEATFVTEIPASASNLVISEIFYHPNTPGEETEFIELMNISAVPIDLSGVAFTAGIDFIFPAGATLEAGARLILAATPGAYASYAGRLNNDGETLTLLAADGSIIVNFSYGDSAPWPMSPDGSGTSLTLIAPEFAPQPGDPASWRPSVNPGGSPAASDAIPFTGTTAAELLDYALTTPVSVEVQGDRLIASIPMAPAADEAQLVVEFSSDLVNWTAGSEYLGATMGVAKHRALDASAAFVRVIVSLRQ